MRRFSILFLNVLLIGLVSYQQTLAQVKPKTPPSEQGDEVVRGKTELVQTDVTGRPFGFRSSKSWSKCPGPIVP